MTILSVTLENFRGFKNHTVAFNQTSILVGLNNAGKSTLIDALRLLSVAGQKASSAKFSIAPAWVRHRTNGYGFSTSFSTVDFNFNNLAYNQDAENLCRLEVRFRNKSSILLWLDPVSRSNFVQIKNRENAIVATRAESNACRQTPIFVLPPIQRFKRIETSLNEDTVRENLYGRLAYRHFRNQLKSDPAGYALWKEMVERTWPKLKINSLDDGLGEGENELHLMIAEPPFLSEASAVGSGLQAWLQIMWFLCRTPVESSIILDEPDAYLHADLQRKIVKIVSERSFNQISIATHSPEIISDVDSSSIIVVRKKNRFSKKPANNTEVQEIISDLGSRHNVQLSKLSEARRLIIYEGDDQKFLSEVALKMGSGFFNTFMSVPYFDVAGVNNWKEAIGAAKALTAATEGHVQAYLIIDRDYRLQKEISEIEKVCQDNGLNFHCWKRKEIENYFVSPHILAKCVTKIGNKIMSVEDAKKIIEEAAVGLRHAALKTINDIYYSQEKLSIAEAHLVEISTGREMSDVVGGKKLVSRLSALVKLKYGCQLSPINLCRNAALEDLDQEIVDLVRTLARL